MHGQKSFNGVGILSKLPLEEVTRGLPGDDEDEQARWIEATVVGEHEAVRLCGLYLPNGNPVPGPKYDYKLAWMARMQSRAEALLAEEMPFLMAGDYNIIPQAEDAARPEAWREDALFRLESREAGAWNRNDGIRIDHFLMSPAVADMLTDAGIDRDVRGREKPSDHVPVWVELAA